MISKIYNKSFISYQLLYILIMPALMFPVISILSLLFDWVVGDSGSVLQILHSSKKQFLYNYLEDWKESLLLGSVFIWFIFLPLYYFMKNIVISRRRSSEAFNHMHPF